ncbi:MAG: NADH-quinone oxidoreductase subunit C [Deltaproteobacteria bacterium HGW-Deltaproteobacteria-12]|jgi:NADH-quinone oxidoreductase subunit C|nr:MAG: NADH-quinone oxidoreductase subunit C [Deltaproteobacteria bacterium HGW-Deltaproteobacteria-12]
MNSDCLQQKLGGMIKEIDVFRGETTVVIDKENLLNIGRILKDDDQCSFDILSDCCGVDLFPRTPRFCVVYHLYSLRHGHRLRLKVFLPEDNAAIDSVTPIWSTANWHERECFDLLGIQFSHHPDLRRILLPEDFAGHPLRKDFPLEGR